MTNIASECRAANIVRDHAMILPDGATPKPDGIFGKDKLEQTGVIAVTPGARGGTVERCRSRAITSRSDPGIGAPRNTPVEIIDRLNREINAALADPPRSRRGSWSWAALCLPCCLPTTESSALRKSGNGPR